VRSSWFTAGALVVVGLIWIGQGLGIIGGSSFMTGDRFWAALGAGLVVGGVALFGLTAIRMRPGS
jgi:hypothetical protein